MQRYILVFICFIFSAGLSGDVFAGNQVDYSNNSSSAITSKSTDSASPSAEEAGEVMTDIFDIKSPEKIGFDKRIIKYAIIALLAIIIICVLLFLFDYFMKKRKKKKEEILVIPPEVAAYNKLGELESSGNMEAREYYFILTGIIRGYIEGRFGIDALEMTTEEFIPRINEIPVDKKLNIELKELLKTSDPVKFAGVSAEKEKMASDFQFVKSFVKSTTPDSEPPGKD